VASDTEHHAAPEIVINRDAPPERQVALVDDFGQRIELSVTQLERLADEVRSPRFRLITGL
jgi:hypothetical protein